MAKREIPEINAGSMADIAFLLLIFFLVTTTMDKDQAYRRSIPKKIDSPVPPPPIEKRNIFAIKANEKDQIMVREEVMQNPDDISDRVLDFYRTNQNKTPQEVIAEGDANKFPMYTRITKQQIEDNLNDAISAAEAEENLPDAKSAMIEFRWQVVKEWENKKAALEMYGKNDLPEIHQQAHVRIEVQSRTSYELFTKIQSELEEAIFTLRDEASMKIFNVSYGVLLRKYQNDPVDRDSKAKIDLLKILYPDRFIEVTPK